MFAAVRRLLALGVGKNDTDDARQDEEEESELTEEEVHERARAIARALLKPQSRENEDE